MHSEATVNCTLHGDEADPERAKFPPRSDVGQTALPRQPALAVFPSPAMVLTGTRPNPQRPTGRPQWHATSIRRPNGWPQGSKPAAERGPRRPAPALVLWHTRSTRNHDATVLGEEAGLARAVARRKGSQARGSMASRHQQTPAQRRATAEFAGTGPPQEEASPNDKNRGTKRGR